MNILIVANHFAVCSARYAADAFTRLGHTVRHIGKPMGRDIWGMQVPQEYVWDPENAEWVRGASINEFPDWNHDIMIVMDSDPELLDSLKPDPRSTSKIPVIVWGVDNHCRDYRRPYFDHYFLAHKSVSVMEWEYHEEWTSGLGIASIDGQRADMTWLPCAYDPVAFPPSPFPWDERQYDVCMIGVMYPRRWNLVQAMRAAGLKVLAGTGLVYDAYRDAHHNSRVALVSSFNGDLPIRLFEGAGMGCVVMHDHIPDFNLIEHDNIGNHAGIYRMESIESAIEAIQKLRDEPEFSNGLCAGNVAWAHKHTWDIRAQVIADWFEARR